MRTSVGILGGIILLFIGFFAISNAASNTKGAAYNGSNSSANAWNTTTEVLQGITQTSGSLVYIAIFALIAAAIGLLVYAGQGGR